MITFTPLLLPVNADASILSTDYASLFGRLSQRTAVLSLNIIKWVKLAMTIFHTHGGEFLQKLPCFQLVKNCNGDAVFFIRRVRESAKRDFEVHHVCVCLSVRPHGTTPLSLEEFLRNFIFDDFSITCRGNLSCLKI